MQPRNTKVFANFAETRRYRYQGREVDAQVHFGYDLASTKQAAVPSRVRSRFILVSPVGVWRAARAGRAELRNRRDGGSQIRSGVCSETCGGRAKVRGLSVSCVVAPSARNGTAGPAGTVAWPMARRAGRTSAISHEET